MANAEHMRNILDRLDEKGRLSRMGGSIKRGAAKAIGKARGRLGTAQAGKGARQIQKAEDYDDYTDAFEYTWGTWSDKDSDQNQWPNADRSKSGKKLKTVGNLALYLYAIGIDGKKIADFFNSSGLDAKDGVGRIKDHLDIQQAKSPQRKTNMSSADKTTSPKDQHTKAKKTEPDSSSSEDKTASKSKTTVANSPVEGATVKKIGKGTAAIGGPYKWHKGQWIEKSGDSWIPAKIGQSTINTVYKDQIRQNESYIELRIPTIKDSFELLQIISLFEDASAKFNLKSVSDDFANWAIETDYDLLGIGGGADSGSSPEGEIDANEFGKAIRDKNKDIKTGLSTANLERMIKNIDDFNIADKIDNLRNSNDLERSIKDAASNYLPFAHLIMILSPKLKNSNTAYEALFNNILKGAADVDEGGAKEFVSAIKDYIVPNKDRYSKSDAIQEENGYRLLAYGWSAAQQLKRLQMHKTIGNI